MRHWSTETPSWTMCPVHHWCIRMIQSVTQMGGMGWAIGGRFKREGAYVYLWLNQVMYGRNQHNIVKQLSCN